MLFRSYIFIKNTAPKSIFLIPTGPNHHEIFESYLSLPWHALNTCLRVHDGRSFLSWACSTLARLEFMVIKNAILILYIYQATRACVGGSACSKQKAGSSLFGNSRVRKCNWKFLRLRLNRAQWGEICARNPTRLSLQ